MERVRACRGQQHLDGIDLGDGEQGYLQAKSIFGYLVSLSVSSFRTSPLSKE